MKLSTYLKPTTCEFCGETVDLMHCGAGTMKWKRARYGSLQVGEKVRRAFIVNTRKPAAVVREISASVNGEPIVFDAIKQDLFYQRFAAVTVRIEKAGGKMKEFTVNARSPVAVFRNGICNVLCCWRHRCERGPGAVFCADHWKLPDVLQHAAVLPCTA